MTHENVGDFLPIFILPITSVVIPITVTSPGKAAFEKCTDRISEMIPYGVERIGGSAFKGYSSLSGDGALYVRKRLSGLYIPYGVRSIGDTSPAPMPSFTKLSLMTAESSASSE